MLKPGNYVNVKDVTEDEFNLLINHAVSQGFKNTYIPEDEEDEVENTFSERKDWNLLTICPQDDMQIVMYDIHSRTLYRLGTELSIDQWLSS